ncbi:MAG: sigma-54-dependent Fis family transcriptional regulator [Acidobacteria bacterium]|nr:sigma-54-dependent Fis family transcriptional regulator [Acidobacteriota bacterium]
MVHVKVLVVEDQEAIRQALTLLFRVHQLPCICADSPEQARKLLSSDEIGCVVQDMNFSPGRTNGQEGADLFRWIRQHFPHLPILLVTAWTSLETAVQLVREGAQDYLQKPWDDEKLVSLVRRFLDQAQVGPIENDFVFVSSSMRQVTEMASRVASSDLPVLITGPNGSGKEKIADLIHRRSQRASKPFIKVNAGAIPPELFESEMFGSEKGAYTGALNSRKGFLQEAENGTLFLDEIGNLPASAQMKLLRVLQSGEYQKLGSPKTHTANVRILSATNEDLLARINEGKFRQDLFFRLNVMELRVPSLRERPDDILPLAHFFLKRTALTHKAPHDFSPAAQQALIQHSWPGNVRELENCIQRAAVLALGPQIEPADLRLQGPAPSPTFIHEDPERQELEAVLKQHSGQISKAAKALGLSRQALYRKMEKLGIEVIKRVR